MRNLFLLAIAIIAFGACRQKDQAEAAPEKPAVIMPLNVRDPSALVMGPSAQRGPSYEADADARPANAQAPALQPSSRLGWMARFLRRSRQRAAMPAGYRAVSLPVPAYDILDLRPGDRIDVLSVFDAQAPGRRKEKFSVAILQNVRVLRANTLGERGVVQLMLNPMEAELATLAIYQGELAVVRRQPDDVEIYPMEMSSYHKLFR